jgi:micrococcal nuclease
MYGARGSGLLGSAALLAAVALLVLRPWQGSDPAEPPGSPRAHVVRAVDGDTLEVQIEGRREDVRLIGIDTPETVDPEAPVECFGPRASSFAHHLLDGRDIRLDLGVERRDAYGRLLAYVRLRGRLVNAAILRRGLARTLTIPPNDRYAERFERLALRAARSGRGLWGAC